MTKGAVVYEAGSTAKQKTGDWRAGSRPQVDLAKCTKCGICAMFCPEACIKITEKGAVIDYDYCKGCGICVKLCPKKAMMMEVEK